MRGTAHLPASPCACCQVGEEPEDTVGLKRGGKERRQGGFKPRKHDQRQQQQQQQHRRQQGGSSGDAASASRAARSGRSRGPKVVVKVKGSRGRKQG